MFSPLNLSKTRLHNLLKFRIDYKLQALSLMYLAHHRREEDDEAARVFLHLDDSGTLTPQQLYRAYAHYEGLNVAKIVQAVDFN